MPVIIPASLPAVATLRNEDVPIITSEETIDRRLPLLRLLVVNLMPEKPLTETHLIRALSASPLLMDIRWLTMRSHTSKNTPAEHLKAFYTTFDRVERERFDGLIITGAPVEMLPFEEVDYWEELCRIMDWSAQNVRSTLYICWGAQAALYHHYGVPKHPLPQKQFGVFEHRIASPMAPIVRGFDDIFPAPHSRHTELRHDDICRVPTLEVVADSPEAGVYIVRDTQQSRIFVTGHSEYDALRLRDEYERDRAKGLPIGLPCNYFPDDNPQNRPVMRWRSHAALLYSNWINHYVYHKPS